MPSPILAVSEHQQSPSRAVGAATRFAGCDSLADLFVRSAHWKARQSLFSDDRGGNYSGEAALDRGLRFAAALRGAGLVPGDVVGFLCLGSAAHAVGWFGVVAGGYVASSLHVRDESAERIAFTLRWLGAKVLVHDNEFSALAKCASEAVGTPIRLLNLEAEDAHGWAAFCNASSPLDYPTERPAASALATIALSSGSTGQPKGVMHSQRSLLACATAGQAMLEGVGRRDTMFVVMNPSFAAWLMFVLSAVAGKARTYLVGRFDPAHVLELMERERATIVPMVPIMWRMVMELDTAKRDLSNLRLISAGGESPTAEDVRRLTSRICKRIAGTYMACESANGSTVLVTSEDLADGSKIGSTGQPTMGTDVRIVDPEGTIDDVLAIGETGEIVVTGTSIAMGYWQDPELTAKKFVDGWWRTGDLGRFDNDGYLWVDGRADNVINTGGIKVHAEEIESAIISHSQVVNCAVVGRPDPKFGQRIESFIVTDDATLTADALRNFLKDVCLLSGYKVPKAFHFIPTLPTGLTGKIDRRALRNWKEPK